MKKSKATAILLFPIFIVLLFSSCNETVFTKEFSPERAFNLHMTADKDGKSFEADIICKSYDDIEIRFTFPEELSGFSIITDKDGYKVNVFGVPDEISEDEINNASLLNVLIGTIKTSVFTNHGFFTEKEDGFEANLSVDSVPVYIIFGKDGYIKHIDASSIGFSANFENSG